MHKVSYKKLQNQTTFGVGRKQSTVITKHVPLSEKIGLTQRAHFTHMYLLYKKFTKKSSLFYEICKFTRYFFCNIAKKIKK